jgi:glycosyltransferase involved in cell wall biosynthesis
MSKDVPQKRVLILADFACATGFAQVAQNVVAEILKEKEVTYQIDVVGINYYGLATEWQKFYPQVRLFPATVLSNGDLFGRTGYLQMLATGAYDITWILQDTFNIEPIADKIKEIRTKLIADGQKPFKFIFYYPIDGEPKENWITKSVSLADIPVVYTKYGYEKSIKYDKSLENKLKIVPHGINNKIFYPLEKDFVEKFRKTFFMGMADNKFLVTNVNRNQPRKDIPRTMQIFKLFKQQVPNSVLYLHMKKHDVGWNIDETARNFELIPDEDYNHLVKTSKFRHEDQPTYFMYKIHPKNIINAYVNKHKQNLIDRLNGDEIICGLDFNIDY